ncbi:hypothetical protein C7T94_01790 [Pedobacter yulinensis]|uniref:MACPF domain-containing protein n=1 Tax=Pedobacter yulinensis TaxID=2126353 RepID=A0A2T3HR55_9SPHI|nr:MAC/perforin domain-containing protein [Pedobacter yulinensis]PST84881.1 hypothetical protein C7T94_01790 [Pedobacter yulinensis]
MKRNPYYLAMLLLVLIGCNKSDLRPLESVHGSKQPMATPTTSRDQLWDVLGFGYNVTEMYGSNDSHKAKIIDVERLKTDYPTRVGVDQSSSQYLYYQVGENARTWSEKMVNTFGGGLDIKVLGLKLFKSTITSTFTNTDAFSSKYQYGTLNLVIKQKRLNFVADASFLQNYLDPNFAYNIQNLAPAQIVQFYGTHVLTDVILGGKLEFKYQGQSSSSTRERAATAALAAGIEGIFNVNTGINYNFNDVNTTFDNSLSYKAYGGDNTVSLLGTIPLGNSLPVINVAPWQATVTPANSQMIDIGTDGLLPIYLLVADPVRREALRNYILQYYADNEVQITEVPVPVYEYYNAQTGKHAYSLEAPQAFQSKYAPYQYNAQRFKAYAVQVPGTVPVYQFYNRNLDDRALTTNPSPGWAGYSYDGVNFYASPSQVAGTIPVYEFYHSGVYNHNYSNHPTETLNWPGWQSAGTPFYAYPN